MTESHRTVGLEEILPRALFDDPRHCNSATYAEWEREVAQPALESKGWIVLSWHTGDGDSFGPLTRYALCILRARTWRLVYG